jgi:aminomethyltransferase
VPVYDNNGRRQIGKATSGAWSPLLKKNLVLASIETPYAKTGTTLKIEYTVEYQRETVTAVVAKMPFYNPEHKRR